MVPPPTATRLCPHNVINGGKIFSHAVTTIVTEVPTVAREESRQLSDAIETELRVGRRRSITTTVPSVVDLTVSPWFPAKSEYTIENATSPSVARLDDVKE